MKKSLVFLIILLLIIFAVSAYQKNDSVTTPVANESVKKESAEPDQSIQHNPKITIEEYIKDNISSLSSEKEVLGGKFYVTKVEAKDGNGVVEYEDGHIALVADFTYHYSDSGDVLIDTFVVRK